LVLENRRVDKNTHGADRKPKTKKRHKVCTTAGEKSQKGEGGQEKRKVGRGGQKNGSENA